MAEKRTNISGIRIKNPELVVDDWYTLGWWFAEQASDEQAEFLSGMSHHIEDGFIRSPEETTTPGDLQLEYIAEDVRGRNPLTRRRIRNMLVSLLERIPE